MTEPRKLVLDLLGKDTVALDLGLRLGPVEAGRVELHIEATPRFANGHGIVHGGYLFLLADTAFAYVCASLARPAVTRTADIAFLAPARSGTLLTATATVRSLSGRTTICDVAVTADDELVAEFRGHGAQLR